MENLIRMALRLLLSATFLISAFTKSIDFSSFELRILDTGLLGFEASTWLAAFLIVAEYAIGFGLLVLHKRVSFILYSTWGFLLIFSGYLLVLLATKGNDINCGCMGETLSFTPVQALVKNVLTMLLLYLLGNFDKQTKFLEAAAGLYMIVFALAVSASYFTIPSLYSDQPEPVAEEVYFNKQLLIDSAFAWRNDWLNMPTENEAIFAFLSMSCTHCQMAAERLGSLSQRKTLPIFLVINGDSSQLDDFREEHNIKHLPACMLGAQPFVAIAGTQLPAMMRISGHKITHRLRLMHLNGKVLR